jgi:hypothetical protein
MTEESFTDEELAFLRHVRFGELPQGVRPQDRVELAETEPARNSVDLGIDPEQQQVLHGAGG